MGQVKEINIKNRTYYFFNDMINIEDFDSNLLKIDKKLYKNIGIYNIGFITIKKIGDYGNICSVNPLHLIINEVDGYFEEENENKYLTLVFTDENKEVLTKYIELWDGIKYEIEIINGSKPGEYGKDFIKIKFASDDTLPLNKIIQFHNMTIIVRSIFEEDGKFYPQVFFWWMFVWVIQMRQYDRIDVSEGMDINKTSVSKQCDICYSWYFKNVVYKFQPYVCNGCHAVSMTAYEIKNIPILNAKGVDYRCFYGVLVKMMQLIG